MDKQDAHLTRETALERARQMMNEAMAEAATPWHEHGAFGDIEGARWQIARARDALAGIAAMLEPATEAYDEQMNMAHRSDAAAVFAFFAEAMREPLDVIDQAALRLQNDLRTGQP